MSNSKAIAYGIRIGIILFDLMMAVIRIAEGETTIGLLYFLICMPLTGIVVVDSVRILLLPVISDPLFSVRISP